MKVFLSALFGLVLSASAAMAQLAGFDPTGGIQLTASNVSSRVIVPATGTPTLVMVTNRGSSTAFVALGDNTIVATVATGVMVLPNDHVLLKLGTSTNLAAITASDRAVLQINAGK